MFGNVFEYNNRKFDLRVSLINGDKQQDTILLPENVQIFQYTNEMNNLNLYGYLEYNDTDSRIDSFLETEFSYCKVTFTEIETNSDGSVELDELSETTGVELQFFIDNYEILGNKPGEIRYRLHLISSNWFNCSKIINYTNYKTGNESIFDIIKKILTNSGIKVDDDSFSKIKSNVQIPYITGNDENAYSAVKWLMNKMYYYNSVDDSIKGLMYNEKMDSVCAYDINKVFDYQGCSVVEINIVKDDPNIQTEDPVNIAYQVRKQKSEVIKSTFPLNVYSYDIYSNRFTNKLFDCDKIVKYYNGEITNPKLMSFQQSKDFTQSQTYWNNNITVYEDQFDNLVKTNGLIINMIGQCGIVPGYRIGIDIPVKQESIQIEDSQENDNQMNKYQTLIGTWYVSKITHFINPKKPLFRQSISLFRNGK